LLILNFFIIFEGSLYYAWRKQGSFQEPAVISPLVSAPLLSFDSEEEKSAYLRATVITADARPVLLARYLEYYQSPLLPYADLIFDISQQLGLDYRLLVAIAQQESNLCKKIPDNSYNCWGWGIHSRGTLRFSSYPEAIETVAKGIKKDYIDQGLTTPEEIMKRYTPLSNGSWAAGVRQFMEEIETGLPGR